MRRDYFLCIDLDPDYLKDHVLTIHQHLDFIICEREAHLIERLLATDMRLFLVASSK